MSNSVVHFPIKQIITESPRVKTFVLGTDYPGMPGQYVFTTIGDHGERPFGIINKDNVGFMISVAAVGTGTTALHKMKVGDILGFRGPQGNAFTLPQRKETIILVAGGYGVAPLSYLAQEARKRDCDVHLFMGARSATELLFTKWMSEIGVKLHMCTQDGSNGLKCYNTDLLEERIDEIKPSIVYVVGPEVMEMKVARTCYSRTIPFEISLERYRDFGIVGPVISGENLKKIAALGAYASIAA